MDPLKGVVNMKAKERFTEMRASMLLHVPFFASLMLDMMDTRVGKFEGLPTAGTNGKVVWWDEDFLASLTLPEAVFVQCHELGHAMWLHMARFKRYIDLGFEGQPFQPGVANVAADFIINDMLVKAKIGSMPKDCLIDGRFTGDMLFEDVYRELMKSMPPQPKGGQGQGKPGQQQPGQGQPGQGPPQPGQQPGPTATGGQPNKQGIPGQGQFPIDTHVYEVSNASESEVKRQIASARNQAKAMGNMPANIERWVESFLKPKVNWKERLRNLITRVLGRDTTTWTSPHRRRLVTQKVYYPSYTGFGAGTVVWATDTSGSMGSKEFDASFAEVSDILLNCRPERLILMACDAHVHNVHELDSFTDVHAAKPEMRGGGGTSFKPVFDRVAEMGIKPDILIYFTDGYGAFPDQKPNYPVLWVATTDHQFPWGDVVKVDLSGED